MPKDHVGAMSGVTYVIPELTDRRDIEEAFGGFADSLPPFPPVPPVMKVALLAESLTAEANTLYLSEGPADLTVTLPATANPADRVSIAQVGAGVVTLSGIRSGVPVTGGKDTAVTAVWDGVKWVGLPFSYSGTRPVESSGGTVVDLNGFRYHLFTVPGTVTFISHKALTVESLVVGAGVDGKAGSVEAPGVAGGGGEVRDRSLSVGDWSFTTVVVGDRGESSSIGDFIAAPGVIGGDRPSVGVAGDWAIVLKETVLGGPGEATPVDGDTFGKGGGAGHQLLAPYPQETESYSYTTGGPYSYDCSYGARREDYQDGTRDVYGDPCQGTYKDQCPPLWNCINAGSPNATCWTQVPTYATRWHCDSGGSLDGTTCRKTCYGDNTQTHTGTRPKPCRAGYVASGGQCVDPRPAGAGRGVPGLIVLRYAHP